MTGDIRRKVKPYCNFCMFAVENLRFQGPGYPPMIANNHKSGQNDCKTGMDASKARTASLLQKITPVISIQSETFTSLNMK